MGCDGGTIPTRDELVKTKKKPEQKDKDADLAAKWQTCALSQTPLLDPIVACELGRLYNKESVIEFLLDFSKFECGATFDHIRGLKDVKVLKLTENPSYKPETTKGGVFTNKHSSAYICPVTGLEMNGRYNFCMLWSCGCVLSSRALKYVKSEVCHKCGNPYKQEDIVKLNCSEEDLEIQQKQMEERRALAKLNKKGKRKMVNGAEGGTAAENGTAAKQTKTDIPTTSKGKSVSKLVTKEKGKGKPDKPKSIQSDPRASKAYKSLFTTSDKAKAQGKAHWVTYNPQYN